MQDKNGRKIKTGDAVLITGAYFKNDNGLFRVEHSPGDATWCGSDHCLHRLNKNGTLSKGKYSTAFWPLCCFHSNRELRITAKAHNQEHAQIEVVAQEVTLAEFSARITRA